MNNYICQSCTKIFNPDDLYPTKIDLPVLTGTASEYFLLCEECRKNVNAAIQKEIEAEMETEMMEIEA